MQTPLKSVDMPSLAGPLEAALGDGNNPSVPAAQCLMCKGVQHRPVFAEFDIDILRCTNCGHIFSSFRGDPHYTGFWGSEVAPGEHHYWSKARAKMHRDFFQRFIIGRSGRLLDMGSGLGFFLKALGQHPDWVAHGCEISPAAVKYAREHLGLKNVICSPLQDADLPRGSFDVITMWDVIDHILRPDPLLRHCHALLKQDGTLFIRTPNVAVQLLRARLLKAVRGIKPGGMYLQGADHLHHYSAHSIAQLLRRNGFVDVTFMHFHPIATGSGWRAAFVNPAKNTCFHVVRALALGSAGALNLDNLFVAARKGAAAPTA
jgi:2-polyprenyl-3-methyl-5-hydroxy-6-metoxy-1,4-benzoquinol methylase